MKFKIEKKDFIIFIVYSIFLLYLCSIIVLNFASLANDGVLSGLIPFKGFFPPYLPATIMLFIVFQIIIFTSVTAHVFNKDKGFGVGLKINEKSNDGYSRWATKKEIMNNKDVVHVSPKDANLKAAGIPLINDGKNIYVDNGEFHNLVIGSTGSGKTECIVKPMVNLLARNNESMVITDPKGEIYKYTAENLKEKGYNVILLNFREPQKGNSWNPLALPYYYHKIGNSDKSIDLLNDLALNILYDPDNKAEPFWELTAADFFAGLALGLFYDGNEKEINLNSINYMSSVGEERYGANSSYIKEYFNIKGENSKPYIFASSTLTGPEGTRGSILATFKQKIRMFSTGENLSEMLSYSNFDMRDIGKKKTAVFLVIHDEKKTYHSLMTIFIKQCYESLIDVAQENGGKLPFRTNFILDEFANMPPLKDVDAMVSAARSRLIRFTFIIQNFAQLNQVYGENTAEIIKGNCSNLVYLISTELKALEEISKMAGEVKSKEKDKTASTPLVTVSDLQKLKLFEAIIIRLRTPPFKTKLEPNYKMNWNEIFINAEYPVRKMEEVQIFDLKRFVNSSKKKERIELNKSMVKDRQPQSGSTFNPFGGQEMNPFIKDEQPDFDTIMKDLDKKIKELETCKNKEEEVEQKEVPKINVDTDSKIVSEDKISDDEYFDDFFD